MNGPGQAMLASGNLPQQAVVKESAQSRTTPYCNPDVYSAEGLLARVSSNKMMSESSDSTGPSTRPPPLPTRDVSFDEIELFDIVRYRNDEHGVVLRKAKMNTHSVIVDTNFNGVRSTTKDDEQTMVVIATTERGDETTVSVSQLDDCNRSNVQELITHRHPGVRAHARATMLDGWKQAFIDRIRAGKYYTTTPKDTAAFLQDVRLAFDIDTPVGQMTVQTAYNLATKAVAAVAEDSRSVNYNVMLETLDIVTNLIPLIKLIQ